ncbi:MAG: A24 family peptidase [Flaviflexus sp.]|nr:A24 family peptidase [Flaviflexus sp.]
MGARALATWATLGALASIPAAGHQIPAALFFSTLCVLSVVDWRTRYLPDPLQRLGYLATAAEAAWQVAGGARWPDVVAAWSAGVIGGLVLFAAAWRTGQLGLGDVKLAGACGAWLALTCPGRIPLALLVMGVVGALGAVRSRSGTFAYGPAIAAGTYAACLAHLAVV